MFSRNRPKSSQQNYGRSKKHHVRTWFILNKKRKRKERNGVMMSGDSPPPLRTSIPSPGFDMPDNVRLGKTTSTPIVTKPSQPDAEVIEEDVPIMEKTVPVPESKPEIVMSGPDSDVDDEKSVVRNVDDDPCTIKCVYFLQQCCECTIL